MPVCVPEVDCSTVLVSICLVCMCLGKTLDITARAEHQKHKKLCDPFITSQCKHLQPCSNQSSLSVSITACSSMKRSGESLPQERPLKLWPDKAMVKQSKT